MIGEPIKARHWYYGEIDQYFGQLDKINQNINSKVETLIHLTDD